MTVMPQSSRKSLQNSQRGTSAGVGMDNTAGRDELGKTTKYLVTNSSHQSTDLLRTKKVQTTTESLHSATLKRSALLQNQLQVSGQRSL